MPNKELDNKLRVKLTEVTTSHVIGFMKRVDNTLNTEELDTNESFKADIENLVNDVIYELYMKNVAERDSARDEYNQKINALENERRELIKACEERETELKSVLKGYKEQVKHNDVIKNLEVKLSESYTKNKRLKTIIKSLVSALEDI